LQNLELIDSNLSKPMENLLNSDWIIIIPIIALLIIGYNAVIKPTEVRKNKVGTASQEVHAVHKEANLGTATRVRDILLNLTPKKSNNDKEFEKYFNTLKQYFSYATNRIVICDYIDHGRHIESIGNKIRSIHNYYDAYYQSLEKIVKENSQIQYVRVECLPLYNSSEGTDNFSALEKAIPLMYSPSIHHIERLRGTPNFNLYILPKSVRGFSSVIIDDRFWIKEFDFYDDMGNCRPDVLNISYSDESEKDNVVEYEYNLILELISKRDPIDVNEFSNAVPKFLEQVENMKKVINV
jgi:hypothetical protein